MATTANPAVGYSNAILYLEHDATAITVAGNAMKFAALPATTNATLELVELYGRRNMARNRNCNNNGIVSDGVEDNRTEDENNNAAADGADDDEGDEGDEADSLASMETLSDNVSIWVDGEKHWISGVDANTTCADLICALLNYQDGHQMFDGSKRGKTNSNSGNPTHSSQTVKPSSAGHTTNATTSSNPRTVINDTNAAGIATNTNYNNNNSNISRSNNNSSGKNKTNNNSNKQNSNKIGNNAINQSTATTKEDYKIAATSTSPCPTASSNTAPAHPPPSATSVAALLAEYVIVKQHRHCEEYLDGSTKVFDVMPPRDMPAKKECELLLRRLAAASPLLPTHVSSLLSTDKDSGMGSPVGSSRSARLRRRKYKSSNWLAQSNTLHPKLSQRWNVCGGGGSGNANERLLKIILAQDETIHRQLTLLREKERQISKIEEEKHRVRERELGKNYLLETYLNGLDEAESEPPIEDGVEIFIDEPYHRFPAAITAAGKPKSPQRRLQHRQRKQRKDADDDYQRGGVAPTPHMAADRKRNDAVAAASATNAGAEEDQHKEIELQLHWLEKVYAINKQLQREEEQLVKLNAKIRKHHAKRAHHTKKEVLQHIEQLDDELALQCGDIRKVEDNLIASNRQLKEKLCVLEKLSAEMQQAEPTTDSGDVAHTEAATTLTNQTAPNEAPATDELPTDTAAQKLHLHSMQSPEDLLKLIAKPPTTAQAATPSMEAVERPAPKALSSTLAAKLQQQQQLQQPQQPQHRQHHHHPHSMQSTAPLQHEQQHPNHPISCINHCGNIGNPDNRNHAAPTPPLQPIDKNILPLHVSTMKSIQKQMFDPHTKSFDQLPAPINHNSHGKSINCNNSNNSSNNNNNNNNNQSSNTNTKAIIAGRLPLTQVVDITRLGTLV